MTSEVADALTEYVEAMLAEALVDSGCRGRDVTAVQLDLFGQVDSDLSAAERQQADWTAWLQDDRGRWCCPACGDRETTAEDLRTAHGWHADLAEPGHPWCYAWPGEYAEGGYSGNGGRCMKLRLAWLEEHYRPAPAKAIEDVELPPLP